MGAITMPSTHSLLNRLRVDFPDFKFESGTTFKWSPDKHTVYYLDPADTTSLLHEVAHAVLSHSNYKFDIDLLKMESEAWDFTVTNLSQKYGIPIQQDEAETLLDSYRDWLHGRSLCPRCQATGLQTDKNQYSCLACLDRWKVNEARTCALRRYVEQK